VSERERRERRESDKERDSERDRGPCDRGIKYNMLFQHHQFCAEKPFLAPPRPPGASLWSLYSVKYVILPLRIGETPCRFCVLW